MSDMIKTICANDQIRACLYGWLDNVSAIEIKAEAERIFRSAEKLRSEGCESTGVVFCLAAIKLLELVEQKEREEHEKEGG